MFVVFKMSELYWSATTLIATGGVNAVVDRAQHGKKFMLAMIDMVSEHSALQLAVNTYDNVVADWCKFPYKKGSHCYIQCHATSVLLFSFQTRIHMLELRRISSLVIVCKCVCRHSPWYCTFLIFLVVYCCNQKLYNGC